MPVVRYGNPDPIHHQTGEPIPGPVVTESRVPASYTLDQAVQAITNATQGAWVRHSAAAAPAWVESDHPGLAQALAARWGCPIGEPDQED